MKSCLQYEKLLIANVEQKRHYFVRDGPSSQSCGLSSGQVWMCELDYKER